MKKSTTVKIRAACILDEKGNWVVWGEKGLKDDAMLGFAYDYDGFKGRTVEYFIEAEIEMPEPVIIKGKVESSF